MEKAPSSGKTVAVTSGVINAANHVLFVGLHEAWNLPWADLIFCSDVITLSVALCGLLMHRNQRKKEDEQTDQVNGEPVIGGAPSA